MIGEEASDHLLEPGPLLGDRLVHAPSQFLLDPPERCPHAIAPCCSFDKELPTAVALTDEGKAKKVEGLRFSEPATSASFRRKAAELDQAGLVRIERQRELLEPLTHIVPEAPGRPSRARSRRQCHQHNARGSCRPWARAVASARPRDRTRNAGRRWRAAVRLPSPAPSPFH